jgi:hypothetical protein
MARTQPRTGIQALMENNRTVSPGNLRVDDFISRTNCFPSPIESILKANAQARMWEQDRDRAYRNGGQFQWDPAMQQIRDMYREQVVDAGYATMDKRRVLKGIR